MMLCIWASLFGDTVHLLDENKAFHLCITITVQLQDQHNVHLVLIGLY